MLQQVQQVFRRYVVEHLNLHKPGFPLQNEDDQVIGYVDAVSLTGHRLHVRGWCEADRVALIAGPVRIDAVPNLSRLDVARVRGGSADLGFDLDLPFVEDGVCLRIEAGPVRYVHRLAVFDAADLRRAERRMILPFLRDAVPVVPSAVRWLLHRDPADKARIKAALRFGERTPARSAMGNALFDPERAATTPGLAQTTITLVVPVYNAFDILPETLDRIARHTDLAWRLILIEDRSTDDRVRPWLRAWCNAVNARKVGQVVLIENEVNLGFIGSVNLAFARALTFDGPVVLVNSDALVPAGWASRLVRPLFAHDNVASVTPMSNDAEILSVPVICQRTDLRPGEADAIDAVARQFHPDAEMAEAPTGVGFCMALHPAYLRQAPQFDTVFGRGYGEEVDWCQQVRALGGRHLAVPGLFVEHRGAASFGSEQKQQLLSANNAIISRRYPRYDAEIQRFIAHDPLATPRLALALGWVAVRQPARVPVPIYLAHSLGGGAEHYLMDRIATDIAAQGSAVVLRVGGSHRWRLEVHSPSGVVRGVTQDFALVKRLLAPLGPRRVVYSCGVGAHDPVTLPDRMIELAEGAQDRIEVLFHDYFPISPSYTLLNDKGSFGGVPQADDRHLAHQGRRADGRGVPLADWQHAWGRLMGRADEVVVFSRDSADKVAAVWPGVTSALVLRPHRLLCKLPRLVPGPRGARPVIGVLGNIGYPKGAAVLVTLSRALARSRAADLVVIGNIDPTYVLTPPARVHGTYLLREIPGLAARYGITCWLIPSIWPETFSYATHEALATGLPVWCFDLGAQAEAVRAATSAGAPGGVLPLSMATEAEAGWLDPLPRLLNLQPSEEA